MSSCSICLCEETTFKYPLYTTSCLHIFCRKCYTSWTLECKKTKLEVTCPCCRKVFHSVRQCLMMIVIARNNGYATLFKTVFNKEVLDSDLINLAIHLFRRDTTTTYLDTSRNEMYLRCFLEDFPAIKDTDNMQLAGMTQKAKYNVQKMRWKEVDIILSNN
jgi:hypothetical protein